MGRRKSFRNRSWTAMVLAFGLLAVLSPTPGTVNAQAKSVAALKASIDPTDATFEATALNTQALVVSQSSWVSAPITGYYCQRVPGYPVGDGGGWCGRTASGVRVGTYENMAACGWYWNLGDIIEIDGYGQYTCYDRGHLAYTQLDIFYYTNADLYFSPIPASAYVRYVGRAWADY